MMFSFLFLNHLRGPSSADEWNAAFPEQQMYSEHLQWEKKETIIIPGEPGQWVRTASAGRSTVALELEGFANIPASLTFDPLVPIMTHCHMYVWANPAFPTPSFSFKANKYAQGWKTATSTPSVHVSPTDKSFALTVCWRPARLGGKGQGQAGPFSEETQLPVQGSPPPCLGKKNSLGLNF